MRNRFFAVLVVGLLSIVIAENACAQSWSLPIRAGWSNASITGSNQMGSESVNGFVGSLGAELRFNKDFGIEFDIAYAQKGAKGTITNEVANSPSNPPQQNIFTFEGETSLDYVEFWAVLVGHLEVAKKAELKGYAGVALANLVSAEASGTANGTPVSFDLKDTLNSVDFTGIIGAGFAYDVGSVVLTIDFITDLGLTSINESVVADDFKTRAYYTMLGVVIPLSDELW